jgi:hypothetical protein
MGTLILNNIEWIFSGIGVSILSIIFLIFQRKKRHNSNIKQKISSGKKSTNIQIGQITNEKK